MSGEARRDVPGTPEAGDDVSNIKGDWTGPIIVNRFAEPGQPGIDGIIGADGADGQGFEYAFARSVTSSIPNSQYPSNAWLYEQPGVSGGLQWFDAAPNLTPDADHLWQVRRAIQGAPAPGSIISGAWFPPAVIGHYGRNADGVEFIFARSVTSAIPNNQYPSNAWLYDQPGISGGLQWFRRGAEFECVVAEPDTIRT